ncbi:MAG: DUF1616 domain-containing protein [Anaerolineales bacterium]|nr:DUF1616 domain-containing protein [Anaerolineales bacterium]
MNTANLRRILTTDYDLWIILGILAGEGLLILLAPIPILDFSLILLSLFFVPGYAFLTAVFPGQGSLGQVQRLTASLGLSPLIAGALMLIASFAWQVNQVTIFLLLLFWTAPLCIIAWKRRASLPPETRYLPKWRIPFPTWSNKSRLDKWLLASQAAVLVIMLLVGGRLLWLTSNIQPQFTEFYLLGSQGKAGNYPDLVPPGSPAGIIVGIVNQLGEPQEYHIYYQINQDPAVKITQITLQPGERWETPISVELPNVIGKQKITLFLSDAQGNRLADSLHVWSGQTGLAR